MMTFRSPSARGPLGIFSLRRRGVVGASTAPAIDVEQTTPIFGAPDLLTQAYGVAVVFVWTGGMTFVLLKVVDMLAGLRVPHEHEVEGLDITQHGEALQ